MNKEKLMAVAITILITLLSFQTVFLGCDITVHNTAQGQISSEPYVGIDLAYGMVKERGSPDHEAMANNAKSVIDQVSSYTNFFVLGSSGLANDATRLQEILQYAYEKGLSFVSFCPGVWQSEPSEWYEYANNTWGNHLLGFYTSIPNGDEPGGRQLDGQAAFKTANNISDAATQFSNFLKPMLKNPAQQQINYTLKDYPYFTSDYGLYWFEYKAGYDTLFTELLSGNNNQLSIALCRGAATALNKEWGAIITYNGPSFNETGAELFNDMVLAYDNGAKYIVVFDSNATHTGSSLTQEHFQAIQQFWQYMQENPRRSIPASQRVAFVLPKDYGVGLRWRDEKIWGIFDADNVSVRLYDDALSLLKTYGQGLDIIYDDGLEGANVAGYDKLIYWNTYNPNPSPDPIPTSAPTASSPYSTNLYPSPSIPEFPAWVILLIALTTVIAAMTFRKKKRQTPLESKLIAKPTREEFA